MSFVKVSNRCATDCNLDEWLFHVNRRFGNNRKYFCGNNICFYVAVDERFESFLFSHCFALHCTQSNRRESLCNGYYSQRRTNSALSEPFDLLNRTEVSYTQFTRLAFSFGCGYHNATKAMLEFFRHCAKFRQSNGFSRYHTARRRQNKIKVTRVHDYISTFRWHKAWLSFWKSKEHKRIAIIGRNVGQIDR